MLRFERNGAGSTPAWGTNQYLTGMITQESFTEAITPLYGNLLSLATKWCYGDYHKAEDALHDAILKAYTHLDQFEGDKFESWLHTILKNTIMTMNHPKKHGWSTRVAGSGKEFKEVPISDDFQVSSKVPTPLDILCSNDDAEQLKRAIQSLSDIDRQIVLDDANGISQAEIAKRNNIARSTVATRLFRTRKVLREQLHKHN